MAVIAPIVEWDMKEISKKDLKILSLDFRSIASRLMKCNYDTGMDLLRKFLAFIDENEIIADYISGFINPNDFMSCKSKETFSSMGKTKQEEISTTYLYLKFCVENFKQYYNDMAYYYASDVNDAIREFNDRIIFPFVDYISGYLKAIGIKMGYDEDKKFIINVNGGVAQVTVADGHATVTAQQHGEQSTPTPRPVDPTTTSTDV